MPVEWTPEAGALSRAQLVTAINTEFAAEATTRAAADAALADAIADEATARAGGINAEVTARAAADAALADAIADEATARAAAIAAESAARIAAEEVLAEDIARLDPIETALEAAPPWSVGDGGTAFMLVSPTEFRHPVMDQVRAISESLTGLPEQPTVFSIGDDATAMLSATPQLLRHPWLDAAVRSARQSIQAPRLYLDGDSRSDLTTNPGRTRAQGWAGWLQMLTRGRFEIRDEWNFGIGGQDSSDLRFRARLLATVPPGVVAVICSTNDRTGTGQTAEWTIARLADYQARALHYGHRLVWIAETPRGDTNDPSRTLTATQMGRMMRVRQWLLDQAQVPGVYVVDPWPVMADPARTDGRALDTMLRDGIHWGAFGAATLAKAMQPVIEAIFPPRDLLPAVNADVFGANNPTGALNPNPMLDGTGGTAGTGCSGSVATGWTASAGAGLAAVCSKLTASGRAWQRLVVSGGPTGTATVDAAGNPNHTAVAVSLTADIAPSDLTAGDVLEGVAEISIAAGSSGLRAVSLVIEMETSAGVFLTVGMEADSIRSQINLDYPADAIAGVIVTQRCTVPSGVISARVRALVVGANFSSTALPLSATVDLRAIKIRKVT